MVIGGGNRTAWFISRQVGSWSLLAAEVVIRQQQNCHLLQLAGFTRMKEEFSETSATGKRAGERPKDSERKTNGFFMIN